MPIDFISGGNGVQSNSAIAQAMMQSGGVTGMRPFIGDDGRAYVTVYTGGDRRDESCYRNQLVANATLRREEWQQLDDVLVEIGRERLQGIDDIVARGLTYNLGNAFGTTVLETQNMGDAFTAELSMDGVRRSQNDNQNFESVYLPIPIIHVDYDLNLRVLEASRRIGNPLDTTNLETSARKVREKLESMLFTATSYSYGGGTIYSFLNHPNRNTYTISTDWDDVSVTGADIVADVQGMITMAKADNKYGPYMLYIPANYENKMDEDYSDAKGDNTIRDRVKKLMSIIDVKTVDTLPDDNVILVQMTRDVVRIVQGLALSTVEWKSEGNFITNYKVMQISVPQLRADQNGNCGIVHGS